MATEFVVRLNPNTYPDSQELPYVYAESCFNGRREIYIISAQRVRFRVTLETETDGPMVLSGERWRTFALANLNRDVRTLHFVEEGDDCFYVTGYNQDGTEFGGYNMYANAGRFSRFQTRVFDFYDEIQTLPAAFLEGMGNAHKLRIHGDGFKFDVDVNFVQAGGANGQNVYELDMDAWNHIEEVLGLEAGMTIILTRKYFTDLLLTGFKSDGSLSTCAHFLGATNLLRVQPGLLANERDDNRMKHICQWPSHQDHFGEGHSFYKRFSAILLLQKLEIPEEFLFHHPIHTYRKVLMKHRGVQCLMNMMTESDDEEPEMPATVSVFGGWRMFAKQCSFDFEKLIRFKFIHLNVDVNGSDFQDNVYPVFHLC